MKVRERIDILIEQYAECGNAELEFRIGNKIYTATFVDETYVLNLKEKK